jgi:hypothetical protein
MNEINILLVGVGGIGFRHFQSLAAFALPANLMIVDVDQNALNKAKEYFGTLKNDKVALTCATSMDALPPAVDVAVVATSSLVRRAVVEELLARTQVKYMILEKILFPKIADYAAVGQLLKAHGVRAHVNCSARTYPGYHDLKKRLQGVGHMDVCVSGSNWGMCCNAIHLIDIMDYLIDGEACEAQCSGALLDPEILESRRKNYIEMTGRLVGSISSKANFIIESMRTGEKPINNYFMTADHIYLVDEVAGTMSVYEAGGKHIETVLFPTIYQSALTASCAESLLKTGSCELIGYDRSCILHLALLEAFLEHYNKNNKEKSDSCPIT